MPMGEAKEGINCDPAELSAAQLERLTIQFITRMGATIDPDRDIPLGVWRPAAVKWPSSLIGC